MLEGGAIDGQEIVEGKAGLQGGREFFKKTCAEHGGIVGGESDRDTVAEKFRQGVKRDSVMSGVQLDVQSVGAEVAGDANFEWNFASRESVHQRGTADGGDAVADAFDAEKVDGVLDLLGAAGFSGMGDEVQGMLGCVGVGFAEIGKRERQFIATQTKSDDALIAKFRGDASYFHGGGGAKLTDRVENKLHLRTGARRVVAPENFAQGGKIRGDVLFAQQHHADGESDFGVDHALFMESGSGVLRELRVVVWFAEERSGPFEEFQELRKATQVIAGLEFV